MPNRENFSGIRAVDTVDPFRATANQSGTAVDMAGFDSCTLIIMDGPPSLNAGLSTTNYYRVTLQDSDDDTTYVDVGEEFLLRESGTGDGVIYVRDSGTTGTNVAVAGYIGNKRYVKAAFEFVGTHTGAGTSPHRGAVCAILERPMAKPLRLPL